jgi:hypothetical protein
MARARLDNELLKKIAERKGVSEKSVREQASREAAKLGIPSEAALLVIARRHNIGINRALKRLDATVRHQVADALKPSDHSQAAIRRNRTARQEPGQSEMAAASGLLLTDTELRGRCADLLRRKKHLDRAVREAMTVVENRLRKLTKLDKKQAATREALVARALHPEQGRLKVSEDPNEQQGVFYICKGLMAMFGNPAHHSLRDDVTEAEALGICGAANVLLSLVSQAKVRTAAPPSGPSTDMETSA